jgi:16S rRNA (cytidine1402-2'-O)-methyltransferase
MVSLEAHASERRIATVVEQLLAGEDIALVTDAGMPAISDPGARLVRAAAEQGIPVRVVPGPSALTSAVALSGLVAGPFRFLGFLPRRGGARRTALESIAYESEPAVLFEAPGRVQALLDELAALCPERPVALCRELTKLHEETLYGSVAELAARAEAFRGEVTLVVGGGAPARSTAADDAELDALIERRLAEGVSPRTLAQELAAASGQSRRATYARVLAARDRLERA